MLEPLLRIICRRRTLRPVVVGVLSRVGRMNPTTEAVLLCFGEVDIRANVIKYCYQKGLGIEECVEGVVERYVSFAVRLRRRDLKS